MSTDLTARLAALEAAQVTRTRQAGILARLTPAQRLTRFLGRAATTPGDGLPYPNNYQEPADSPAALQALALSTQSALNARMNVNPAIQVLTLEAGWKHAITSYGQAFVFLSGRLVATSGMLLRNSTDLPVTDNVAIKLATIPAGFRPAYSLRVPGAWSARDTNNETHLSAGTLDILADGTVNFYPNFTGTIVASSHYVSLAGITWITP
jgi:hypothetical protein